MITIDAVMYAIKYRNFGGKSPSRYHHTCTKDKGKTQVDNKPGRNSKTLLDSTWGV